eukprot:TRINITY_DN24009_c0_g1_i2.p1 TRINITY_DN24009_c0_g1~~TRINITY_DN24009_c0_g1_i2.p1  ORF type:complete len:288 (+),score=57.26 TRINITY_DN24009_c0_g1_i2:446-1309(+)
MDSVGAGRPAVARLSRLSPQNNGTHSCNEKSGWEADSLLKSFEWDSSYLTLVEPTASASHAKFLEVPHVRQLCSWDCGLACVLMVLKSIGIQDCDMNLLAKLCNTKSVWTVDLAHLLRRFSVNVAFFTVTIGANPNFVCESFYKEHMAEDGERVTKLFEKAPQAGILIQCRSLTGEELSMLMCSGNYIAIALVDKYKLSQPWLEDFCLADCCILSTEYTGHYVVICGYDKETNEFEIRDPASCRESERISLEQLDEARKAFGTDEDILLISLKSIGKEEKANPEATL